MGLPDGRPIAPNPLEKLGKNRKAFIDQLRALDVPVSVLVIVKERTDPDLGYNIRENFHVLEIDKIQQGLNKL